MRREGAEAWKMAHRLEMILRSGDTIGIRDVRDDASDHLEVGTMKMYAAEH